MSDTINADLSPAPATEQSAIEQSQPAKPKLSPLRELLAKDEAAKASAQSAAKDSAKSSDEARANPTDSQSDEKDRPSNGYEKRINSVTRKLRETERAAAALKAEYEAKLQLSEKEIALLRNKVPTGVDRDRDLRDREYAIEYQERLRQEKQAWLEQEQRARIEQVYQDEGRNLAQQAKSLAAEWEDLVTTHELIDAWASDPDIPLAEHAKRLALPREAAAARRMRKVPQLNTGRGETPTIPAGGFKSNREYLKYHMEQHLASKTGKVR